MDYLTNFSYARLEAGTLFTSDVRSAGGEFGASVPQVVGRLPTGVISIDALPDFRRLLVLLTDKASRPMVVVQPWQAALQGGQIMFLEDVVEHLTVMARGTR